MTVNKSHIADTALLLNNIKLGTQVGKIFKNLLALYVNIHKKELFKLQGMCVLKYLSCV